MSIRFINKDIEKEYQQVTDLLNDIKSEYKDKPDNELLSHLAKYSLVYLYSFIENSVKRILIDFIKRQTNNQHLLRFYNNYFYKNFNKANHDKIIDLLNSFDNKLKESFLKNLSIDYLFHGQLSTTVNSISKHRNEIAHKNNSDITINQVELFLPDVGEYLFRLESLLMEIESPE